MCCCACEFPLSPASDSLSSSFLIIGIGIGVAVVLVDESWDQLEGDPIVERYKDDLTPAPMFVTE